MNTTTKSPCFYCFNPVDLANDNYVTISALHSMPELFGDGNKVKAHEQCAKEADETHARDRAFTYEDDDRMSLADYYGEDEDV